jgi:hypothetical protein
MCWQMERPSPVFFFPAFVLKKGSKIRSLISVEIPQPLYGDLDAVIRLDPRHGDLDGAALEHGFDAVDEQIDEDLLQAVFLTSCVPDLEYLRWIGDDRDVRDRPAARKVHRITDLSKDISRCPSIEYRQNNS